MIFNIFILIIITHLVIDLSQMHCSSYQIVIALSYLSILLSYFTGRSHIVFMLYSGSYSDSEISSGSTRIFSF